MKRQYSKWIGQPFFGHSASFAFMPSNWMIGIAFGPKWIIAHFGPFNIGWHRPKNMTAQANGTAQVKGE